MRGVDGAPAAPAAEGLMAAALHVFVGCYTTPDRAGHGEGIVTFSMDASTGAWQPTHVLPGIVNPSFLALHPRHPTLYCVHGGAESQVSAFTIDPPTGVLTHLNSQPSGGANPVHLSIHPDGGCLVIANYTGGTIAVLPIHPDGTLAEPNHVVALSGDPAGPDPVEQPGPHPHDIPFDPAGRFVAVPDKGLDRVFVFGVDPATASFTPASQPSAVARPGAGPRHLAFNPGAPFAYAVNELDSTVTAYAYNPDSGALDTLQVLSTLPADFKARSTGAEIAVAPSGQFVYISNRGHDSIAIFAIDASTGRLSPVGWEPTRGSSPRHFAIDPSGRFLYAANQASDSITTFAINATTGHLDFTGQVIQTGSPVTIVFATHP